MGARPYDPSLGRFLAVDPVDGGSLNNYDYAGQDPINGYDLDGRMLENDVEASDISAITLTYPTGDHGTDTITFIAVADGPNASVVGQIHVIKTDTYWRTYATVKVETAAPVKSHGGSVTGLICSPAGDAGSIPKLGRFLGSLASDIIEALFICTPPAR